MNARPILFSAPMIRALLEGRKTQTRRIVTQKHLPFIENIFGGFLDGKWNQRPMPYGKPGDLLYVRETWCPIHAHDDQDQRTIAVDYAATYHHGARLGDHLGIKRKWRPSIHMPRWASRLTLRITDVRVQRLQDISEEDAKAEGVDGYEYGTPGIPGERVLHRRAFSELWESINGPGSWDANPYVWAITFDVIHANVDQVLREAA